MRSLSQTGCLASLPAAVADLLSDTASSMVAFQANHPLATILLNIGGILLILGVFVLILGALERGPGRR